MYVIKSNRKTNSYTVRKINRVTQVVRVGRRGIQGETGATGQQGPQGDPATNLVQSVNGKQGVVVLNATDVGADTTGSASQALQDAKDYTDSEVSTLDSSLATVSKTGSYNDLSDKPSIPSITGLATEQYVDDGLATKVDKIAGKALSTNDYTTLEKTKLAGIQAGAEVNVQSDWDATTGDAAILNKPTIPSIAGLATEAQVQDVQDNLDAHEADTANPHNVTKAQVGLGNVDNTSDANKPVSTAQQEALDGKVNFPTANNRIPIRGSAGNQSSLPYTTGSSAGSVPLRKSNGEVEVGAASVALDATNKSYVDTALTGKVSTTSNSSSVYANNSSANPTMIPFSQALEAGSLAQRSTGGTLAVGTPTSGAHATTKTYVDGKADIEGSGVPNGLIVATVGKTYKDLNATDGFVMYIKHVGTGNTGWDAVPVTSGIPKITASPTQPTTMALGEIWIPV